MDDIKNLLKVDGGIKLMATGYCEKCKFKDLELATFEAWDGEGDGRFYEIHCKHAEICKEWNEKYESLNRAFNVNSAVMADMIHRKFTKSESEECLEKLHKYLDENFGTATDGKLRKWG